MAKLSDELAIIRKYTGQAPVPVMEIGRGLGLEPVGETMPDDISGKIVRASTASGYRIVYNSSHHSNRQRFTCAHEIGHYLFHRDLLAQGVGDTLAYRAMGSALPNPLIGPIQETEANRFAANLLMPFPLIASLEAQGVRTSEALARALGVSEAAIRIRRGLPPDRDLFVG